MAPVDAVWQMFVFEEKSREGFLSLCLTCGRKSAWLEKEIGEHEHFFFLSPPVAELLFVLSFP